MNLNKILNTEISLTGNKLNLNIKSQFYFDLGILLESGIDLKKSLEIIVSNKENSKLQFLEKVIDDLISGHTFYETLSQNKNFTNYELFNIKTGEATGQLSQVINNLANFYKRKISQRKTIINAITYPLFVLISSVIAIIFMLKFIVPVFTDILSRFNSELPKITGLIIAASNSINLILSIVLFLTSLVIVFVKFYRKNPNLYFYTSKIIESLPFIGDFVKKSQLLHLFTTLEMLNLTKTPLSASLDLIIDMTDYPPIRNSLNQTKKDILYGTSLSESFENQEFTNKRIISLLKVGEEVNKMDIIYSNINSQLHQELEQKTKQLNSILEPLLIVFIGLIVGIILISMYLPIFQMGTIVN